MSQDRLLVIDDEVGFRNFVRRVAESCGFETFATGDAEAFKDRVRTWRPSVIVMDLQMPNADGIELLRDLSEAKSTARVLIASGVDAKVLETVRRLGAERGLTIAGTLQKPIRAAELRASFERLREVERPLLANALSHAIKNGHLILEYQPKLDGRSRRIVGVEALVRWQHPTRGIVPPDQFIALADESGLIHDLTEWVANAAIHQSAVWRQEGLKLSMAINISARNLDNLRLPDQLEEICASVGVPPDEVTLELTESAAMGDPVQTMDVLTRIRLKGFCLSVDDFRTGYSSLVQLHRLPFSELKIDRSFVTPMNRAADCRVIVEATIALAQKLGLNVVAEGVETGDVFEAVFGMGCDSAQGYFISRPVAAQRLAEIVRSNNWAAA